MLHTDAMITALRLPTQKSSALFQVVAARRSKPSVSQTLCAGLILVVCARMPEGCDTACRNAAIKVDSCRIATGWR